MRGKAPYGYHKTEKQRITPAYAGKSARNSAVSVSHRDHPRLCGEKLLGDCEPAADRGSPPPMRGKVRSLSISYAENRITPAYAGKSNSIFRTNRFPWDHPRLCGEKRPDSAA